MAAASYRQLALAVVVVGVGITVVVAGLGRAQALVAAAVAADQVSRVAVSRPLPVAAQLQVTPAT